MNVFEIVVAVAVVLGIAAQTAGLFLIFKYLRRLDARAARLQNRLEPLIGQAEQAVTVARRAVGEISVEARACVAAISATAAELTKITREQVIELRDFVADTTDSARSQVQRLDRVVTRTADRVEHIAWVAETSLVEPIREIAAIITAIKRALAVFFRVEPKQINQAYQDEEMFI